MDLFDDSDEDSDDKLGCPDSSALCNLAFIQLMIIKPFLRKTFDENSRLLYRKIALFGSVDAASILKAKLDSTHFKNVYVFALQSDFLQKGLQFDVVVNLNPNELLAHPELLVSGGTYMAICTASMFDQLFNIEMWSLSKVIRQNLTFPGSFESSMEFVVLQKRAFTINTLGAIYWTGDRTSNFSKLHKKRNGCQAKTIDGTANMLHHEYSNLEEVTVTLSLSERKLGIFSDASHAKAVYSMQTFGLCILPGLFSTSMVMEWGSAAIADMTEALVTLKKKGIDLLKPGDEGPRIENFHELSMREALRCDLRNGRHIRKLSSLNASMIAGEIPTEVEDKNSLTSDPSSDTDLKVQSMEPDRNIRHHPALLSVLHEVLNPLPLDPRDQLGNWGLWNFEGKGPEAGPPDFMIGEVGVVMSLPGCADQTIHADTAHLYVHTQLPGHYVNLFVPAVSAGSSSASIEVGQTAFILGSHQLRISAHVMNEEGGQQILEERLVRPHLKAGDALIFDCRILHFGLANQYPQKEEFKGDECNIDQYKRQSEGWRPLLYVNYHQKFFQDPKNWNDKEKLFD